MELRRGIEDRCQRRKGQAEHGGILDELYGPAGAGGDPARSGRHLERCGGHHPGSRVGSHDTGPGHHQCWGPPGLVGRDLRSIFATGPGGVTGDAAGRRLNNAPEWSGRVWIDWTRAIGGAISMSLRADSTWKTTVFFTPFNDSIQQQRPLGLLDISAELGPTRRRWSVAVYARNLTNEDYITGSTGSPLPAIGGRPGDVRQLGVEWRMGR